MTSKMSQWFSQNHARKGRGSGFTQTITGFTLIELLVVIAIIGILSSIVLASLSGARKRGRDGRRIADISQLKLALELYYDANQAYPTTLSALKTPGYIPAIPKDPKSNLDYAYVALQGAGINAATCASYHLGAKLEINTAGAPGSPFLDDKDGTPGGTYGTGVQDGTICNGSSYAPGAQYDIAPVANGGSNDFDGSNDATNLVYDMRP